MTARPIKATLPFKDMPASPPTPSEEASEIEEEVRDFSKRFARLVVSRAFREGGTGGSLDTKATPGDGQPRHAIDATTRGRNALVLSTLEAEMSLRGSQRLASQLQDDADLLRFRVLPSLRENARHLHALYVAIDRVTDHVMPEIEDAVARMEKAAYDLEEMRKEQVDTRIPQMSYGLGSPWGAGLWSPRNREAAVSIPEVFDTNKLFRVAEGGLAPL